MKKIFFDLDGVLADYNSQKKKLIQEFLKENKTYNEKKDYKAIASQIDYSVLDVLNDGKRLLEFLESYPIKCKIYVLGSTGNMKWHAKAKQQKMQWLKNKALLPKFNKVYLVPGRKLKAKFAKPDRLLIDDLRSNIDEFIGAGGHGILYTDYKSVETELIKFLEEK